MALALFFTVTLAAHGQQTTSERGAELLAPFKQNLQAALKAGLAQGHEEAIGACRLEAPAIAEALSQDGVRVGRTSHRLRNPADTAPEWAKPLLTAYLADASDREPRSLALPGGRSGYVEPIVAQPLCLSCHGESLSPDVAARITELYPEDRAVGFKSGDLRGIFWVEFPSPK
jgi:hypothetical protein